MRICRCKFHAHMPLYESGVNYNVNGKYTKYFAQNAAKFFCAPSRKKYMLDQKMDPPFLMGRTSSITMQSLGNIAQCAPAVDAKMWCFCLFVFLSRSESGVPCVRGVHSSNKHCVAVYCPISTRFAAFFPEGTAL